MPNLLNTLFTNKALKRILIWCTMCAMGLLFIALNYVFDHDTANRDTFQMSWVIFLSVMSAMCLSIPLILLARIVVSGYKIEGVDAAELQAAGCKLMSQVTFLSALLLIANCAAWYQSTDWLLMMQSVFGIIFGGYFTIASIILKCYLGKPQ